MQKKKQVGFTLIELMVVIAIIAILASILIPSIIRARGQAQLTACVKNLETLGKAYTMYQTENDSLPCPISSTDHAALISGGYLAKAPLCPTTDCRYLYIVSADISGDIAANDFYPGPMIGWMEASMSIAPEFATMTPAPVPKFSWVIVHESISHVEFVGSALPLPGYCDSYGLVDNLEDAMAIWAGGVSCIKNLNSPAGIDRIYGFSF